VFAALHRRAAARTPFSAPAEPPALTPVQP